MANSTIIEEAKNYVIGKIIADQDIIKAIDSPDKDLSGWNVGWMISNPENISKGRTIHLFRQFQYPETIEKDITFITVTVDIPTSYNKTYVKPRITITVFSHRNHMTIFDMVGVTANRNDYIGMKLDAMFNKGNEVGVGEWDLLSNVERVYNDKFMYRQLIFETTDLKDSFCD